MQQVEKLVGGTMTVAIIDASIALAASMMMLMMYRAAEET